MPASVIQSRTILRPRGMPCRLEQPQSLASAEPEDVSGGLCRQPLVVQIAQHLQPRQLLVAHDANRHPRHLQPKPGEGVIPNWVRGDILTWALQRLFAN